MDHSTRMNPSKGLIVKGTQRLPLFRSAPAVSVHQRAPGHTVAFVWNEMFIMYIVMYTPFP